MTSREREIEREETENEMIQELRMTGSESQPQAIQ